MVLRGAFWATELTERLALRSSSSIPSALYSGLHSGSFFPDVIAPTTPDEWSRRYECLEVFLYSAMRLSMVGARPRRGKDLATLENILTQLFPTGSCADILADIRWFRRNRRPVRLPVSAKQLSLRGKEAISTDGA